MVTYKTYVFWFSSFVYNFTSLIALCNPLKWIFIFISSYHLSLNANESGLWWPQLTGLYQYLINLNFVIISEISDNPVNYSFLLHMMQKVNSLTIVHGIYLEKPQIHCWRSKSTCCGQKSQSILISYNNASFVCGRLSVFSI